MDCLRIFTFITYNNLVCDVIVKISEWFHVSDIFIVAFFYIRLHSIICASLVSS